MDKNDPRRLGENGFSDVPAASLGTVADRCRESGDGRYRILSSAFVELNQWWTAHDESGGIPAVLARTIEQCIVADLPSILEEDDKAFAASAGERQTLHLT